MRIVSSALGSIAAVLVAGFALTACATADGSGGAADAAPASRADARQAPDAPVAPPDAPVSPDAHVTLDSRAPLADAPPATPDASAGSPDAGTVTGSIATMNMSPPTGGAAVTLDHAVIVATRISSSSGKPDRYGELFLQDRGGGLYAGAHVFCDTSPQNPPACDPAMRDLIKTLAPGDVVNVTGTYYRYMSEPPEIKVPTITSLGTQAPVQALAVDPSMLAMSQSVLPLSLADVYVQVSGPITVSSTTPGEFASTSGCAANFDAGVTPDAATGMPYHGFEARAGGATLAIGFEFSYTLDYCLPDCPGYACTSPYLVTANESFQTILGIASVDTFATPEYVRIDPIHDSDMSL